MPELDITQYQTLVFDCDGVLLNSNKIKSQAFYKATKHFGHESAQAFVDYHMQNGGISRYAKVKYFIKEILKQEFDETLYQDLLARFARAVKDGLMACDIAEGLSELKTKTKSTWFVVSGGDQNELREVFSARDLEKYFDGGIFGSPDSKDIILAREISAHNITNPALFLGDSKYDYQAASLANIDFVFLHQWTEVDDWEVFCKTNGLKSVSSLKDFVV
ncbi:MULTISPECIES: HAD family hydrolase [unclassified Oceanobacter]|uniref:HAD family hydrolase n=1 Tax=unclassified Oceanobacter TaxID=2620260 RepID=UPI0027335B9E|nr:MULTISPECIES: HAD hydrolase-like protein [unclassified Oceanobacter]MDP2548530.1 HAD hydrolase-like protein [Oceanobacter sp. 4_MG-2023]MDP2608075.1 HAD hydrolase-like protein [Oceanobacter sp. 1_MG-2023]MDP2611263.1 HAD hydrolase-like protein [Oceanobacter sp. 2_MG-2023]